MLRRGQAALYIVFLFFALVIIIMGAIVAPIGARFSTDLFVAGENLLNDTRYNPVSQISDPAIRSSLENTFDGAIGSAETNIEVSAGLFEYSWVLLLVLTGIVLFLVTRSLVAFRGSGGGVV